MTRRVIEYVAPWLVDHPDEVEVAEVEGEQGVIVLEVSLHPDDVGKMIGRRGRIIRSLRALARAAGQREDVSLMVEVVD